MPYTELHTTGYPRSGNNWVNKLLSDLLHSPVNRDGLHWYGPCNDGVHQIRFHHDTVAAMQPLIDAGTPIAFIYRDPRSVFVSRMFFSAIDSLDKGLDKLDNYAEFVRPWWECQAVNVIALRYEDLHASPVNAVANLLRVLNVTRTPAEILATFDRHTIRKDIDAECRRRGIPPGSDIHGLRTGLCTDWMQYFKRHHGQRMQESAVGTLMLDQGYIVDPDWWRTLPSI